MGALRRASVATMLAAALALLALPMPVPAAPKVPAAPPVPAAPKGGPAPRGRTLLFGAAVSLSGAQSKEGLLTQEGYDFWARYVNADGGLIINGMRYPVAIRYLDDSSSPPATARAAETLISKEHIDFLLGPYGSAETFAAAAVAERHGVPLISSGGSAERTFNEGYRYVFGVQSPARKYLTGIIELAVRREPRPQTVAISAASDAFSREVQQGAVQSANDHGLHVVYADNYSDDPASITAAATAIVAKHPDVILNAGHLQDALILHRALESQGADAKMYGYSVGPDTPQFRTALGASAQAVLGSAQWSAAVNYRAEPGFYRTAQAYARAFSAQYGHAPDYHDAEATAAGLAYGYALQRAHSIERKAVRNALARLNVTTFFGQIKFDSRGINIYKPMVVNQIQDANLVTVYPYRLANARPIYPAPKSNTGETAARQ
jgi:branched-chain amino acid transport system substrate-binding protein